MYCMCRSVESTAGEVRGAEGGSEQCAGRRQQRARPQRRETQVRGRHPLQPAQGHTRSQHIQDHPRYPVAAQDTHHLRCVQTALQV